jgi:serine/threonine protein kinase
MPTATLKNGQTIDYVDKMIGEGGMKEVYFTRDKKSVVCFFKNQADGERLRRLEAVTGRFNPTTDPETGKYFGNLFCWPSAIVTAPRIGVVCPTYPAKFFFKSGPFKGKEKQGKWFTAVTPGGSVLRDLLPAEERGTWDRYLGFCIQMARAIRRMHSAGLAHSDLSPKNVLVDPSSGTCVVIDIDSLVVPGIYPPDVIGTEGYIAPEVLATKGLKPNDPKRKHACVTTDQHALAVLFYEYLLRRHPLRGPKIQSVTSREEDDELCLGSKALFIEHPTDHSNRPGDLKLTVDTLGPHLKALFLRAFVEGLHAPNKRPTALEWERALLKTFELLHHCPNPACTEQWFVVHDRNSTQCPHCRKKPSAGVLRLNLQKETKPGCWLKDGEITIWHGRTLHRWHIFDHLSVNERLTDADRQPVADCHFHGGQWILINRTLTSLVTAAGNPVPLNQAVALTHGARIHLAKEPRGRIAEVEVLSS